MTSNNKEKSPYHFGLSGIIVWVSHISIGLYLIYIGLSLINQKNNSFLYNGIFLILLGSIAVLYHIHLWYYETFVEYS